VSDETEQGDDGLDSESYGDDLESLDGSDVLDDRELQGDLHRDHDQSDLPGRGLILGEGLTEYERELADERNRIRELESTRDRFERFAGDGELGSGGGANAADRDALAVIDAAERFGLEEIDEHAQAELDSISEALAIQARALPKRLNEYEFYGIIAAQSTKGTNILLTIKVPWEWREEVFRAMDTMPFAATIKMTDVSAHEPS
jgi:hypothetical protein